MSKNLEVLVESHRIARERVKKGLNSWAITIDIKSIIDEPWDESIEQLAKKAKRIGGIFKEAVKKVSPQSLDVQNDYYDSEIADLLEMMCTCEVDDLVCEGVEAVNVFDSWMTEIYDFADIKRIWTGG